ncbi:glycosyltransferase family 2 protein [Geobacter sp.]|uniref:glycosyltransferase family 2 protein n=1 Tax=Geobacter sp. TaxID=46610 RepID=UPI00262CC110|nr:glycosyltransferase family 2 protein [Geobacter sp.]
MSGGSRKEGLSAVMIARNAERYLSMSLRSLRRVSREIVLVDTGSDDDTAAIASRFGCRIFRYPWGDDFSAAKNYAIEQAQYSWVLSVDADEVLFDKGAAPLLAAVMAADAVPAYRLWIDNLLDSGRIESHQALRLFRNDPRIRFVNPVHESVGESLLKHWPDAVPPVLDLRLRHYGYLSLNAAGKHRRNLELMERWVAAQPDSIYARYKLGMTLAEMGEDDAAYRHLRATFELFARCTERQTYPFLRTFVGEFGRLLEGREAGEEALRIKGVMARW